MGNYKDDVFAALAKKKREEKDKDDEETVETSFEKAPEDSAFSTFLPTEDDMKEMMSQTSEKSPSIKTTFAEVPAVQPLTTKAINPSEERDIDYDYARTNLRDIIDSSKIALEGIKNVAEQTCHPRAYEVLTLVVNSLVDANKKLIELHKQRQDLEMKEKEMNKPTVEKVTNNNVFIGNSAQLLEYVKKLKKEDSDAQ